MNPRAPTARSALRNSTTFSLRKVLPTGLSASSWDHSAVYQPLRRNMVASLAALARFPDRDDFCLSIILGSSPRACFYENRCTLYVIMP